MRCLGPNDFIAAEPPVPIDGDELQLWLHPPPPGAPTGKDPRWQALLARYLDADPATLRFATGEHGKPHLADAAGLDFNISHSRGVLLVGIGRTALGVDIEVAHRGRPVMDLATRYFAPAEADALARLDPALRAAAFLRLWSCKEAILKALGTGIGFGLDRLEFALDPNGTPTGLNVIAASAGAVAEWHIVRVEPAPLQYGAVAWHGRPRSVRAFAAMAPAR